MQLWRGFEFDLFTPKIWKKKVMFKNRGGWVVCLEAGSRFNIRCRNRFIYIIVNYIFSLFRKDWYQIPMSKLSLNWDSQKGDFSLEKMLSRLSLVDWYFVTMLSEDWYFAAGIFRKGCHYKNSLFTDWE